MISNSIQESYIPHNQVVRPIEATKIHSKFENGYSRVTANENLKRFSSSPQENGSGLDQSCSFNKGDTISSYVKVNKIKSNQPSETIGEATKNQARISGMKDNTMTSQIGYITMNEAITRNQNQTVTSQQNQGTNNQTSNPRKGGYVSHADVIRPLE